MSSKLSYNNVSLTVPRLSRDPKNEEQVFLEELRLANKSVKKAPAAIYRSGQAPAWVAEQDEEQEVDLLARKKKLVSQSERQTKTTPIGLAGDGTKAKRQIYTAQVVREQKEEDEDDAQESEEEPEQDAPRVEDDIKRSEQEMRVLKIDVSQLEVQGEASSDEESDDETLNARRARARDRFLRKAEDEKVEEKKEVEDRREGKEDDEKEEDSSEYETDSEEESEDEYASSRPLLKPVFVSKKDRETVAERKRMEADEEEAAEALKRRKKERKKESKRLAQEEIKREEELKRNGITEFDGEEELPDDDDDLNEEEELEKWKVRELTRIKSQKEDDEKHDAEQAAINKRRAMTDEQIIRDNKLHPLQRKEKGQMRFLQRYYHPGGYFQDDDEEGLRLQDFAQPTGADRVIDRTLLPEVLQVKKFGLKGRTKWTHLTDQDTSGYEYRKPGPVSEGEGRGPMIGANVANPWINIAKDPELKQKIVAKHKMGGLGGEFTRPSKKPKAKK